MTNAIKKLLIATDPDYPDFGVMTDRNKVSNGLFRFGMSPVVSKILGIIGEQQSPRSQDLGITLGETVDFRTITQEKYLIATNVASHPNQWTGYVEGIEKNLSDQDMPDRKNLFECMHPKSLEHLRLGQAVLLLDQTHEGYNASWLWEWFYLSLEKYKIPPSNIIFITGDLMSPDLHKIWCENFSIHKNDRIKVLGYSLFEEAVYRASQHEHEWNHEHITYQDHLEYKTTNLNNIKTYNCLQKRPRNHRLWLFRELCQRNILDSGICTMNKIEDKLLLNKRGKFVGSMYFQNESMDPDIISNLNNLLPLMPQKYNHYSDADLSAFSHHDSGKWQMMLNKDILLDSWISVISEASADEHQCFCSEKIFKPIVQEHPFMVWGDRYTMAKMKEMGYQTFDNWWSEDWDNKSTRQRLNGMCEVLERLCKLPPKQMLDMYTDMKELLKYNSKLIETKSKSEIGDEIKFIVGKFHG